MKKILYITRYPGECNFNLKSKYDGQIKALSQMGYDVYYFIYDSRSFYLVNDNCSRSILNIRWTKSPFFFHVLSYIFLCIAVIRVLNRSDLGHFDYAYLRLMPQDFFNRLLKIELRKKGVKYIIEVPTYIKDGNEKPRFYIRVVQFFLNLFGNWPKPDLYALIGDLTSGSYKGAPAINIENGVDVSIFPYRTPKTHHGINMISVAGVAYWHGIDRIIEGLKSYSGEEVISFYIVGPDGDGTLESIKELINEYHLQSQVFITGPLFGKELDELVNKCDLAFSSLAPFRKRIKSASALKNREYMSRGIPFVYASADPVLDEYPSDFVYQISNDDTPVCIEDIICFVHRLPSNDIVIKEMRDYAQSHMTWEFQFSKVFNYLNCL